jgi:NADH:ubiquinone oxidoreductase subunit 3 (subunit A)
MRKPLVAGNWKMHGSRAENAQLVRSLLDLLRPDGRSEVLLCPPFVYLWEIERLLKDSDVALGAQSLCAEAQGAFTGEVSGTMLRDVGCRYVLVGHSERRQLFGEHDALVARKFMAAQAHGLTPVLCVGETLGGGGLRAGLGNRHRAYGDPGAGAGRPCVHPWPAGECGFEAFEDTRAKFDVRYYLVAILFIVFDLEIAFLFPWAVSLDAIGGFGLISMGLFLLILVVGFIYEWKKGALEWD